MQGYSYSLFLSNSNCKGYPEEILKELNFFRRKNHYFPFIRWHNPLAGTGFNNLKIYINLKKSWKRSLINYCKKKFWIASKFSRLEKISTREILY